jgi:hypothetical protein
MLASSPNNIRFNGTGRAYVGEVAGTSFNDLGELETLSYQASTSSTKLKSTRNAARATILEVPNETEASLSFGMREMTEENLKMALLGSAINTDNQSASHVYQTTKTWAADLYLDLGYLNVFSTKVSHGTVTSGPFAVGDTVTGGTSSATGKVAYVGSGFIELVNVSGTLVAGETISSSAKSATVNGVETLEDVVITDSAGTTRRVQGTAYTLDPDYGYIRKLSTGSLADTDKVSFDYEAVTRKYIYGLSAGSVTKKLIFVADKDDQGPRQRWTFHKVQINLNGDFPLIGEGAQILQATGTVLADTTQPSGQEYYKLEIMP